MPETLTPNENSEFAYPVGTRVLRSVDEFRAMFLPAYLDPATSTPRVRRALDLLLEDDLPPGSTVLDYGAGAGVFAYYVASARPRWVVEAWDSDPTSIEIAEDCFSLPNIRHALVPIDAWRSLSASSYDAIALLEVIEHVGNAEEMLTSLAAALRKDGVLVLSTPHAQGRTAIADELHRRVNRFIRRRNDADFAALIASAPYERATDAGHISLHSIRTLGTLLKVCGLRLEAFELAPRSTGIVDRLLPETIVVRARRDH